MKTTIRRNGSMTTVDVQHPDYSRTISTYRDGRLFAVVSIRFVGGDMLTLNTYYV